MGRFFGFMVEKNFESPEHRKFKYRVVYQGNNVVTQNYEIAMFQDLGSAPASMEAGKAGDCYGCFHGNAIEQADAEQAYVQAKFEGGTETWISLPIEAWPDSWFRRASPTSGAADLPVVRTIENTIHRRPVVRLLRALYGHPDAGSIWEHYCHKQCLSVGFEPVDNWPSCYFHKALKIMLTIYVDDLKVSGPRQNLREGWNLLSSVLDLEPEGPNGRAAGRYLGCEHKQTIQNVPGVGNATTLEYDMEQYLSAICDGFESVCSETLGRSVQLRPAKTPFLEDDTREAPARAPAQDTSLLKGFFPSVTTDDLKKQAWYKAPKPKSSDTPVAGYWTGHTFTATERATPASDDCVTPVTSSKPWSDNDALSPESKICVASKKKKRGTSSPPKTNIQNDNDDPGGKGQLGTVAASMLMRLLYAARYARFDLLRAISKLAGQIAYWDVDSDKNVCIG